MKDYKAIHRVDWYEDYDDSDGGYSDIYVSDDEANKQNSGKLSIELYRDYIMLIRVFSV